ncbi:hypothetical protein ACFV5K_03325, partial [Streptomyces sp. NPDC059744]
MSSADDVTSSWTRIVSWLGNNAPASAQALNPPATDADMRHLNDTLGFRIPQALESWLRLNNGSTAKDSRTPIPGGFQLVPHSDSSIFPGGEVFLDCRRIIDQHQTCLRIADDNGGAVGGDPARIPLPGEAVAHYGMWRVAGQGAGTAPVMS